MMTSSREQSGYTPMMAQFLAIKAQHPDAILLYRMGDFYETFFEDATIAAAELELTLTSREGGPEQTRIPMAGVPHHALENYLPRLIARGYRVAICEQMEDPATAKGLVRREVVRIVTPGTVLESGLLAERVNNYLAAIHEGPRGLGLAYCDVSTGEFRVTELVDGVALAHELSRLGVSEVLVSMDTLIDPDALAFGPMAARQRISPGMLKTTLAPHIPDGAYITPIAQDRFEIGRARTLLREQFQVHSLEPFGIEMRPLAICAAGAMVAYLAETQRGVLPLFSALSTYHVHEHMVLDAATRKNLELVQTARDGEVAGSLLSVLDQTQTAMGGRRLRQWLLNPLLDRGRIEARQQAVAELVAAPTLLQRFVDELGGVRDLERLAGRLASGRATPRDVVVLADSVFLLPAIADAAATCRADLLRAVAEVPESLQDLAARIRAKLVDSPPINATEGQLIRDGAHRDVDDMRALLGDNRAWLTRFEAEERERTGIRSLKVNFSKSFGYFIEITHANRNLVPEDYQRKQTLVNAERYVTPSLKEREAAILQGQDRLNALEFELFLGLREEAAAQVPLVQRVGDALAVLDTVCSLARVAIERGYCRPTLAEDTRLMVRHGRHPVVEALVGEGAFVPNDVMFDGQHERFVILTGPNMAGKSTYMRQIALIVLLAQIGAFVPASEAYVGIVDRIFTRIGAVDDLKSGQSTFMVEMNETAHILHHASARSLIVLDEIGRGTSTLDGLSIAWSVAEHLAEQVGARTIFATHYHELTSLSLTQAGVKSYRMLVEEHSDGVIFLRRVVPGGADRSYGIEVARLAGLPPIVVARARQVLQALERDNRLAQGLRRTLQAQGRQSDQLSLFEPAPSNG